MLPRAAEEFKCLTQATVLSKLLILIKKLNAYCPERTSKKGNKSKLIMMLEVTAVKVTNKS